MLVTTYSNNDDQIRVYQTDESQWETETPFSVCNLLEKRFKGKGEWIGFAWWRNDIESMAVDKYSHGQGTKSCTGFNEILAKHLEAAKNVTPILI